LSNVDDVPEYDVDPANIEKVEFQTAVEHIGIID